MTVLLVFPGGGTRTTVELPGVPRVGEIVVARWGGSEAPTRYVVGEVEWDVNENVVRVYLASAGAGA